MTGDRGSRTSYRVVVVGLGSPIMSDDAVGLVVSERIGDMDLEEVDALQEAIGGLDIIPVIQGYRHAVIVDAIQTRQYEPGTIMLFDPEDFEPTITDASAHDVNLATAMSIGLNMDAASMPLSVRFVAVEVEDLQTVREGMTPKVAAAVDSAVNAVLHIISGFRGGADPE